MYACDDGKVVMEGCEVTSLEGTGVYVHHKVDQTHASTVFTNTKIHNCGKSGLAIQSSSSCTLRDCEIVSNKYYGAMISGTCEMTSCTVSNNEWVGVAVLRGGTCTLSECILDSNGGCGVRVTGGSALATLTKCSLTNNEWGVAAISGGQCIVSENHAAGNRKGDVEGNVDSI